MPARLRVHAQAVAERSHVPYSGRPEGVAVLLDDGRWTAAPRLENASFPLTIPALQGALALGALLKGRPVAVAGSRPFGVGALGGLQSMTNQGWRLEGPDVAVVEGLEAPVVEEPVRLTSALARPADVEAGAALALRAAEDAVAPASDFPVGAALEDVDGRVVTAANVEFEADWTRGLCAERVALVRAAAAGLGEVERIYVACAKAPGGTPCGACRQVIAELAPRATVVLWRGGEPPAVTTPEALLPGAITGDAVLGRRAAD